MHLKVLILTPSFPPAYADGGPVQSSGDLVKNLIKEGAEVTVLTTNRNGNNTLSVPLGKAIDWYGAKVYYFQVHKPWWYGFSPSGLPQVRAQVCSADVVHCMAIFSFLPDFGALWAKFKRKPYIVSPRGNLSPFALKKGYLKKFVYYSLITKPLLNSASTVQCMTPMDAGWAASLGLRAPIVKVPNGIDFDEFYQTSARNILFEWFPDLWRKTIVLFLGRIDPIKGLDLLLNSWSDVTGDFPDAVLVIIGPDSKGYRAQLESLASKLGISKTVRFAGEITGTCKYTILSSADLFVMPSYSENFGLAIAESMAAGVPVLASDRCAIISYLRNGKDILVVPCKKVEFATAIRKLLLNKELRMQIAESGQHRAKELFDIKHGARSMLAIYGDAIKHTKA